MKSTLNLPTKLKELRKKNKYSQEYVAEQLNISRQAISHWENGKAYPDIDNLVLLAELYDVSVDELLQDGEVVIDKEDEVIVAAAPDDSKVLEMLGLAVVLVLSLNIPFGGIITSIVTIIWLKNTKRDYPIIFVLCVICLLISIHELNAIILQIFVYGNPKVYYVD